MDFSRSIRTQKLSDVRTAGVRFLRRPGHRASTVFVAGVSGGVRISFRLGMALLIHLEPIVPPTILGFQLSLRHDFYHDVGQTSKHVGPTFVTSSVSTFGSWPWHELLLILPSNPHRID